MSVRLFRCFVIFKHYTPCFRVFIVDFEQVNTFWVYSGFCICLHLFCWYFYCNKNIKFLSSFLKSFMLKQTCRQSLQVCLSIYDLSLMAGIKELSIKEIRMQLSNQNCKNQLNLVLFFFEVLPFVSIVSP